MPGLLRSALTRRGLLGTGAAALGSSALPSRAVAQAAQYPRRYRAKYRRHEISDPYLPPRIVDSYKKAVTAMLQLPPTDPRNWYRNALVHLFDCPHGNWWFLPWHLGYLGWFERTCRELSGDQDFSLPYWDWTKTPRVPAVMFEQVMDPNNGAFIASFTAFKTQFEAPLGALWASFSQPQKDVLAQRGYNNSNDVLNDIQQFHFADQPNARGLTSASPDLDSTTQVTVSIETIRDALKTPTFAETPSGPTGPVAGFGSDKTTNHSAFTRQGTLESQPHNNVHVAMGGFMGSFLSPVDPIFFLHHGNIDRLWDVWTRRQVALQRPTLPQGADLATWSGEQFLFFSDEKGQPVTKTAAGDYASLSVFDYDYTPGSGEDEVPATAAVASVAPTDLSGRSFSARITSPVVGASEPAGGVAEMPAAALQAAGPRAPSPVAEITLNLAHADAGRRFRVLVSPPGGGNPVEAGAIAVFGHHVAAGPATFTVPLPQSLTRAAAAAGGNVALNISIVPLEQAGGAAMGGPPRRAGAATGAGRAGSPAPQVTAIQVRTG